MSKLKFLFVVDDDPDDIGLFAEAVNSIDPFIHCYSAVDSQQALNTLSEIEVIPDIIFLDLNMPRINGRQCLEEIRKMEKFDRTPVVIYTTSSYEKDIIDTKSLGASYFFT